MEKRSDPYSDFYQEFQLGKIILQLMRKAKGYDVAKSRNNEILDRIRIIRPFIKECLEFMEASEKRSHLPVNVTIFLNDEKAERDVQMELDKAGVAEAWQTRDQISDYCITLSYAQVREFKKNRDFEIYLFSEYGHNRLGSIYLDLDKFEIQT